jgi:aminoglycoside phosphotransferase (APT) family kinase protein
MTKHTLPKYIDELNLDILSAKPIIHENALSSAVFLITLKKGERYILKIPYNEVRFNREVYFLKKLKNQILVPKIEDTIIPTKTHSGAILMEYIEGDIVHQPNLTNIIAHQMGMLLAKLHKIPCDGYGKIGTTNKLDPNIKSAFAIFNKSFEEHIKECGLIFDAELLKKLDNYFSSNLSKIKSVDGPCITHRDFKPGNVIVKNDKIKSLIDWEIAHYYFAEEDFSQMQYLVWNLYPHTKKTFFEGYKSQRPIPNLEIMPLLNLNKCLGAIGFTIVRDTYKNKHKFIFDFHMKFLKKFIKENID